MAKDLSKMRPSFGNWLQMIRPKTLTAALIPFLDGALLAYAQQFAIRFDLLLSAILTATFIQVGTNLINDAADFETGADGIDRLGPKRAIQQGIATKEQVFKGGLCAFILALLCAIPLVLHGGWPLLLLIFICIVAGYCYTAGPRPLAYMGCGELFVLIFFGWVATAAGFWLHAGKVDSSSFLLGTQIGLLSTVLIAINNLRDIVGDARVGKRTLAVRFGERFARFEITFALYGAYLLGFFWLLKGYVLAATLPWGMFFLAVWLVRKIWSKAPSSAYNVYLGIAALLHLTFGILIGIAFFFERVVN